MKSKKRSLTLIAAACLAGAAGSSATAATVTYVGPDNGNWNVNANWSPLGLPNTYYLGGDDVVLGTHSAGTSNLDVTLNTDTTFFTFNQTYFTSLTLNSTALSGFMILNETAGGVIGAVTENIGTTISANTFNQSGASSNFGSVMNLGVNASSSSNTYNISDSGTGLSLSPLYGASHGELNIGVSGSGTFNQSDGVLYVDVGDITLGVNAGGSGVYNFSGGTINVGDSINPGFVYVGGGGTGLFNQSGGTITANAIRIGSTGGTGTYNYSGGIITAPVVIGSNGTFNLQSGGILAIIPTVLAGGTFNIAGGLFAATGGVQLTGGLFQLQGNSDTMAHLSGSSGTVQNGALLGAGLTLNLAAPATFSGIIQDGGSGTLALAIVGGKLTLGGAANTYSGLTTLQTGGTLTAGINGAFSPNSNVSMTGGTLDAGNFTAAIASLTGFSGTVNVNASGNLAVGASGASTAFSGMLTGTGTFTKTGAGALTLAGGGSFTGTLNVQGGALANGAVNGLPTASALTFGAAGNLNVNFDQALGSLSSGAANLITFSNNSTLTVGGSNTNTTSAANFSGAGTLIMSGTGNFTLGLGAGDSNGNPDAALGITVNSGQLTLDKQGGGVNAVGGALNINGGVVLLNRSELIADTSVVTLSAGTLNLNGFSETIGGLAGTGGNVALGGGTLIVAQATTGSYGGGLAGPGTFVKSGAADLTLTGASTYTGTFTANAGRLILQGPVNTTGFIANSGGTLRFATSSVNLNGTQIQANIGGTIEYSNATIANGFLRGAGAHTIVNSGTSTFNGVTTFNSTTITQNGLAVFNNFTNGGTLNNSAALTFNGGTNSFTGTINVNGTLATQDFGSSGIINIAAGAVLTNSGSDLILGGGSRTYIGTRFAPGGTLTLQGGTTLEVNGALLVNDGTINGVTVVNFGGQAQGIGTYGPVNVTYGGLFQPGFASFAVPGNSATISALSGSGTIDNATAGGNMNLALTGNSVSTFSGPIQNTAGTLSLSVQGSSSLTLLTTPLPGGGQSINTYAGGTSISPGGTLIVGAPGALPAGGNVTNNGAFIVNANSVAGIISGNGSLTVGTAGLPANLMLKAGSGASKLATLNLNSTSQLDLTNNPLILEAVNPAAKPADIAQLAAAVLSGRNGGAWNGPGITSSLAAAHPTTLSVAVADNAALGYGNFGGQNVDSNSILAVPAVLGDVNLDGIVNAADFTILASNFNASSVGWTGGDFNNDGVVNFADFAALSNDFGDTFAAISSSALPAPASGVPEPASLALLGAGLLSLVGHRRTRPLSPRNAAIRTLRGVG